MLFVFLALVGCASLASAQGGAAVMAVSATVVNTCFFGADARCARPGTSLVQTSERLVPLDAATVRQRVVHL